ncbi:VacJ family lipoprotein [Novosphingobium sp.]|uniref:MlaA family lipoprotein n=1 Tax=Novosphingobium sp. TaxID=1874826 RepID=UPI001DB19CC2|nr:VacJ family lipoprotein [Novosphingobium sp.]MBX9664740.1 VacJ family lipoprotein [Novosphingobium sp.]
MALVLAALAASGTPAHAQALAAIGDEVSAAVPLHLTSVEPRIEPILQWSEVAPSAPSLALAVRPLDPTLAPIPASLLEPQAADEIVLAPGPAEAELAPIDLATPGDPWERTNRGFFKTQSSIDRRFFRPVAQTYEKVVPKPVRSGLRNVLRNLSEPIVFVNDLLQLRPGRALRTLGRFAVNSTVGLGGTIDVAKKLDLPYRSNGFGNTLGRWGVGPGPYLYLPLIGPTTLRDLLAGQIDGLTLPVAVGFPFNRFDYQLGRTVVTTLDTRAEADADLQALLSGAADPYATLRSVYLQSREAAIADARGIPIELAPLDDPLADPAVDEAAPETGSDNPAAVPEYPAETPPEAQPELAPAGL